MKTYVLIRKRAGVKEIAAFNLRDLLKAKQKLRKEVQFVGPFATRAQAEVEAFLR